MAEKICFSERGSFVQHCWRLDTLECSMCGKMPDAETLDVLKTHGTTICCKPKEITAESRRLNARNYESS